MKSSLGTVGTAQAVVGMRSGEAGSDPPPATSCCQGEGSLVAALRLSQVSGGSELSEPLRHGDHVILLGGVLLVINDTNPSASAASLLLLRTSAADSASLAPTKPMQRCSNSAGDKACEASTPTRPTGRNCRTAPRRLRLSPGSPPMPHRLHETRRLYQPRTGCRRWREPRPFP